MTSTMLQHTAENVPKGIIPLENVRVRAVDERDGEHAEFVPVTIEDNFLSFSHNTQQNLMASLLSSFKFKGRFSIEPQYQESNGCSRSTATWLRLSRAAKRTTMALLSKATINTIGEYVLPK